ncbi:hypothetical protein [Alteribacter keqinensis]|nr:hypothetical protein [Alteribacter keqinensis]
MKEKPKEDTLLKHYLQRSTLPQKSVCRPSRKTIKRWVKYGSASYVVYWG